MGARGTKSRRIGAYGTARMEQCTSTGKICKPGHLGELSSGTQRRGKNVADQDHEDQRGMQPSPWRQRSGLSPIQEAWSCPARTSCCDQGQHWGEALQNMPCQRGHTDPLTGLLPIHSNSNNLLRSPWSLSPNCLEFPHINAIVHVVIPSILFLLINSCLLFKTQFKCDLLDQIAYLDLFLPQALLAYKAHRLVMDCLG